MIPQKVVHLYYIDPTFSRSLSVVHSKKPSFEFLLMEKSDTVTVEVKEPIRVWDDVVLRVLALGLTLVSTIVMFVAKETQTVQVQVAPTLPSLSVTADAKYSYSSALIYFVVINTIACCYATLSLLLVATIKTKSNCKSLSMFLLVSDMLTVALLYSGSGAAAAIGVVAKNGNSHIGWNKICGVFGRFCRFVGASIAVSLLGSLVHLVLVVIAVVNLQKRSLK